jgi:hypothetical protein
MLVLFCIMFGAQLLLQPQCVHHRKLWRSTVSLAATYLTTLYSVCNGNLGVTARTSRRTRLGNNGWGSHDVNQSVTPRVLYKVYIDIGLLMHGMAERCFRPRLALMLVLMLVLLLEVILIIRLRIREFPLSNLGPETGFLRDVSRGFSPSLQANNTAHQTGRPSWTERLRLHNGVSHRPLSL